MSIALFHFHATQIKRSAGQSAVAAAAYRAGEKLHSEYYGEISDYTRKGGVICSEILLPSHAPPEYADRETLWNAVEKAERGKKAQLAYSFDIALQNEFSLEENIALARQFLLENFVSRGMVVDFAVHQPDREDGGIPNPHFHVLCPIRPIEQNGKWGLKQRRVYELDEDGNRIRDADGKFVFNAVPTTDWGIPETLEYRSHRHRVRGALDDELFPLRPNSRGVPGMAQTDHHHLGHPQRPRIHYGVCDALLPGGPVDAVQSLTAYGNFRWHCGLDRGASHARPGLNQYISFGRSWL